MTRTISETTGRLSTKPVGFQGLKPAKRLHANAYLTLSINQKFSGLSGVGK